MIKTTRTRLELRQEPDRTSSAVGILLVCAGTIEAALSLAAITSEWALPSGRGSIFSWMRFFLSVMFAASAWLFLRGRSRVVLDLDHRMAARYMGVGGGMGGNQSWDLAEFTSVMRRRRARGGVLPYFSNPGDIVCLRRDDGSDLEIYWSPRDAEEVALRVAAFTGLAYLRREKN